ncbi:transposase [Streptomyces sp. NBRC 110611]|nr:transposase [Streptomyces sp. NBRC 110611]
MLLCLPEKNGRSAAMRSTGRSVPSRSGYAFARVYYPLHAAPYTPAHHFTRGRSDPAFRTKPQLAAALTARRKAAGSAAGRWSPTAPTPSATTGTSH